MTEDAGIFRKGLLTSISVQICAADADVAYFYKGFIFGWFRLWSLCKDEFAGFLQMIVFIDLFNRCSEQVLDQLTRTID